jgi:penicillin-binding protein 1A
VIRFLGYSFAVAAALFILGGAIGGLIIQHYSDDLPDYTVLRDYEPPVMTRIHASSGELIAEYARERRMFLPIQSIPDVVKQAYISAEDKNFYSHSGLDFVGIGRAAFTYFRSGGAVKQGASTITQQVAKNFLLTNDRTLERKIREAILSLRIENTFTKDKILELYLNEIYLGLGAYGVAAASLMYFDKSVHELTIAEAAYLAALPKAPNNYHPFRQTERAIERRNWVVDRMLENGYITFEQAAEAKASPLQVDPRQKGTFIAAADFFAEEVRRNLIERYSDERLYSGGLSVRTTLDPQMQKTAHHVLREGLVQFDRQRGWRGPVQTLDAAVLQDDWGKALAEVKALTDVPDWTLAVVLDLTDDSAIIGLRPGRTSSGALVQARETGAIPLKEMTWAKWATGSQRGRSVRRPSDVLNRGDVIFVEQLSEENRSDLYALRQKPEVEGALVAMDPTTGRVKALVGGFSFADSEFNRATQAARQPGSSFKPFIYAAALDNGYTPSSVVMDAPVEIDQGPGLGIWRPQNYSDKFYGPQTLRNGIERSRNVMTVRLAQDMGMPLISEYARRFGIYDNLQPVLSMSLGAGETTVLRLTGAYGILANGGRKIEPTLIDRIQDRYGNTIYRHDARRCEGCSAEEWANQSEPEIIDEREQVLDPMTAYQITSMLEGVIQRGTAAGVKAKLDGRPMAGKTGTTNDYKDAWFVGYSQDLVVGVYVGYDNPRSMGRGAAGGQLAAPIFAEFVAEAMKDYPKIEFRVPPGLKLLPIDRRTGLRVAAGSPDAILEGFKPGTLPPDSYSIIGYTDAMGRALTVKPEADRAVISGTGGLY